MLRAATRQLFSRGGKGQGLQKDQVAALYAAFSLGAAQLVSAGSWGNPSGPNRCFKPKPDGNHQANLLADQPKISRANSSPCHITPPKKKGGDANQKHAQKSQVIHPASETLFLGSIPARPSHPSAAGASSSARARPGIRRSAGPPSAGPQSLCPAPGPQLWQTEMAKLQSLCSVTVAGFGGTAYGGEGGEKKKEKQKKAATGDPGGAMQFWPPTLKRTPEKGDNWVVQHVQDAPWYDFPTP